MKWLIFSALLISTSAFSSGLPGRSFVYEYRDGALYETFFSQSKVYWRGIKGADANSSGVDEYQSFEVDHKTYMINWIEDNGSFVTLIINEEQGSVFSSGQSPQGNWFRDGVILDSSYHPERVIRRRRVLGPL